MYGLVNAAMQELVVTKFGKDKWDVIRHRAGITSEKFNRMESYPDELTYRLVGIACEVLGITPDDALKAFGEFWVLYTGKEGYGNLFDIAGDSLRDFLLNLDNLHARVGQNFPKLKPPSFRFDVLDDVKIKMHYHTSRDGLCAMVIGLLNGLALRFNTELQVEHATCRRKGAEHCEFLLTLPAL